MVRPNAGLLTALLDMLVDGKFDLKKSPVFRIARSELDLRMSVASVDLTQNDSLKSMDSDCYG
ncbi:hypothetical protein HanXRQr2_Chr01g0005171 [Helianthus annuus]|uniref:Neurobeachin alpha-solenoid region domain-containing protein n=1 Tax=Helianthus annuus TaxID=4232 RepID=A0A9K3JT54_HELAN|nr:hypothetical protein HanXRQr2_Chr01g0005171 [Helianthus annuus]